jgi:hypothetical protein
VVDDGEKAVENPLFQLCEHDILLLRPHRHAGEGSVGRLEKLKAPTRSFQSTESKGVFHQNRQAGGARFVR